MKTKETFEYELNGKKVEARDFTVYTTYDAPVTFTQSKEIMYMWAVGMTGELNIQEAKFHSKFAAKISDSRIICIAAGQWVKVEVALDD